MVWQYALGLIIGGVIVGVLCALIGYAQPGIGRLVGLLGVAAAVAQMGASLSLARSVSSILTVRGSGESRAPAIWLLAGIGVGVLITVAILRGDEGEPSGARASTPRFLAISGLVLTIAAFAPTRFGGFGSELRDGLVVYVATGVTVGLAALAFATRANQPESPMYVALTVTAAASLVGLLVAVVDSENRLVPFLLGLAVAPLLVGGTMAITGLLRPLAVEAGRTATLAVCGGLALYLAVAMIASAISEAAGFGLGFGFGLGVFAPG
jgi:hypothetical protein